LPSLVDRLLDLLLHLLPDRLQRLIDLLLDLLPGQLERLFHLLAHGLGNLPLQVSKDRLDSLPNLIL
jgi:hypothetical protein